MAPGVTLLGKELGFPKAHRLRTRREFLAVQKGGRRFRGRFLIVMAEPGAAGSPTRLGVTVSRRVGNAVVRNRVKRLIREAFRLRCRQELAKADPLDVVVLARPRAKDATFADVRGELLRAATVLGGSRP